MKKKKKLWKWDNYSRIHKQKFANKEQTIKYMKWIDQIRISSHIYNFHYYLLLSAWFSDRYREELKNGWKAFRTHFTHSIQLTQFHCLFSFYLFDIFNLYYSFTSMFQLDLFFRKQSFCCRHWKSTKKTLFPLHFIFLFTHI